MTCTRKFTSCRLSSELHGVPIRCTVQQLQQNSRVTREPEGEGRTPGSVLFVRGILKIKAEHPFKRMAADSGVDAGSVSRPGVLASDDV
jgi:hypothetical protein